MIFIIIIKVFIGFVTIMLLGYVFWVFFSRKQEKAMATHSRTLAWRIPWKEGPGRLKSMGSLGVGHD